MPARRECPPPHPACRHRMGLRPLLGYRTATVAAVFVFAGSFDPDAAREVCADELLLAADVHEHHAVAGPAADTRAVFTDAGEFVAESVNSLLCLNFYRIPDLPDTRRTARK